MENISRSIERLTSSDSSGIGLEGILTILGVGGIAVALIEWLKDWFTARRNAILEQAKKKLETVSAKEQIYMQLATYYTNVSARIRDIPERKHETGTFPKGYIHDESDFALLLYSIVIALKTQEKNMTENGLIVKLDNLDAETIVTEFGMFLQYKMYESLGYENVSTLTSLLDNDSRYHLFYAKIREPSNRILLEQFAKWCDETISNEDLSQLSNYCFWYAQLLIFELNNAFKNWYGEKPDRDIFIENELLDYLKVNYKRYYNRVISHTAGKQIV